LSYFLDHSERNLLPLTAYTKPREGRQPVLEPLILDAKGDVADIDPKRTWRNFIACRRGTITGFDCFLISLFNHVGVLAGLVSCFGTNDDISRALQPFAQSEYAWYIRVE
jgi:hypothetical protein